MPSFELDGKTVEFEPGEKILSAAMRAGIQIPHYCYHPGMSVVATCRMCMVDVIDMGNGRPAPKLQTSCSMDAVEGMKVETMNEKVKDAKELVMEYLLINHPLDCPICDQSGNVCCRIIRLNLVAVNPKWSIPSGFTAGVISVPL